MATEEVGGENCNMKEIPSTKSFLSGDDSVIEKTDSKPDTSRHGMIYGVQDRPPWTSVALMGLQHFSVSFSGMLTMPIIIVAPLCFSLDRDMVSQLVATSFFMCGVTSLMQTGFGSRLPIVQGASLTFVVPILVMMNIRGPCPPPLSANATIEETEELKEFAYGRMREIQGSLCLASIVQILIGFTGLAGVLLPIIGPITIASSLILIGLPLIPIASDACGTHWGISSLCLVLIILFSQFLDKFDNPCPRRRKFPLFTFFPILLAVAITWALCLILTAAGVFPDDPSINGYLARTDIYSDEIKDSKWVRIPYPGQWGFPTASAGGFIGMLAAIISGIVESIGDYHACALIGGAPPPTIPAINRGVGMEGIGCLLAGLWGSGAGYTSYSSNIAAIGLTKVASRSVIYFSSILFIVAGIFAKFSMLCASLPEPIIGATMAATFGMVASVGFANLQFVKVDTSRNLFILGIAMFAGIGIPDYLTKNPEAINTGSEVLDQVLDVLLGSSMLIGGIVACLLDNIVRGTPEEKGIGWRSMMADKPTDTDGIQVVSYSDCYDLPFGMAWIRRTRWTRYLPFSPTFAGFRKPKRCRRDQPTFDI